MSIQQITKEQLRRMGDQEGLILQGCGGDPQEWVDGINQILTEEGILKKGAKFEEAYTFQHDDLTCLLFPFRENMELDMGKLAVWRLATHSTSAEHGCRTTFPIVSVVLRKFRNQKRSLSMSSRIVPS